MTVPPNLPPKGFLPTAKKVGASVLAALSTPEAVKAEKSVAVIVLARLALTVPAYAFLIDWAVRQLS